MDQGLPPGWHQALQPPLTYRVGRRLYFVDREGNPWRVRAVYLAPPDWRVTPPVPQMPRSYYSRLFVNPSGKRLLYNPKYDFTAAYNPRDWSPATLERQLDCAGTPAVPPEPPAAHACTP